MVGMGQALRTEHALVPEQRRIQVADRQLQVMKTL